LWQANQGEVDMWTFIRQNRTTRKNNDTYPGPSPFAGPMSTIEVERMLEFPWHCGIAWNDYKPYQETLGCANLQVPGDGDKQRRIEFQRNRYRRQP
jgi:hypothetical protein